MSALIDLQDLRRQIEAASADDGAIDAAIVTRRWLEQVERELTASRAVLDAGVRQDRIDGAGEPA